VKSNPYQAPRTHGSTPVVLQLWSRAELVMFLGAAALGPVLVLVGEVFKWPDFCTHSGWFGVHFLDRWLYAIFVGGNEALGFGIVAAIWASYTSLAALLLLVAARCARSCSVRSNGA
jgi:hypothetical protein